MAALVPARPKIYHIVHLDRLASIIANDGLWSDAETLSRGLPGTTIGMHEIKQRRRRLLVKSHPGLKVGDCVPFYFCPRSVMLYVIAQRSDTLAFRDGEDPILHLQADFYEAITWADHERRRWAFTNRNAGTNYFADFADVRNLDRIQWDAMLKQPWHTENWPATKDAKQAEFLLEGFFPWNLIERVGCRTVETRDQAAAAVRAARYRPPVLIVRDWYHNFADRSGS